jgi:NADPH:quinone reductase-like Zn-dependent oxidoreductase
MDKQITRLANPGISKIMQTLKPFHIISLRAYRPKSDLSQIQTNELIAAWEKRPLPEGVVYSELCEQVSTWSDEVAAEIDNRSPYALLEYSIIEPEHAANLAPDFMLSMSKQFDVVEGLYKTDFRFLNENTDGKPEAIMFNLFEINGSADLEQGFVLNWVPRAEFRSHDDGFFSAVLHQRIQREFKIAAFNRAEIRDAASYATGIEKFEKAFPREERRGNAGAEEKERKPPVRSFLGMFRIAATLVRTPSENKVKTMHCVRIHCFGDPSVLKLEQDTVPNPGPGQVRVAVMSSAVNALDLKMRSGEVSKIFPAWFPDTLGYSVAGIIDAVGAGVSQSRIGEEVYGINHPIKRGGYAELIVGPAENYFRKPNNIDFNVAASIPSIFATAYGALFGRVPLMAGQRILIHGGSGAVGSIAVQLAKSVGAYVIATASTHNLSWVKELGANEVIDYKKQKFEEEVSAIDFVLDTVGAETRERSWLILKEGGVLATLVPPFPDPQKSAQKNITAYMVHGHSNIGEILPKLTEMIERKELSPPPLIKTYALEDAAQAHTDFATSAGSRIVLEVATSFNPNKIDHHK